MRVLIARLRARLGDFWYYTLMLFLACRLADALNFFVGAWLVPKYVDPKELGAVLPLTTFATFLVLPAFAFAMTFMKEVSRLAVRGEYGQLKSLMRGVFVAAGLFLVLGVAVSRILMPHFLERIRVVEGSLGVLIMISAFIGCVAPIYSNALQALKKFRTLSLISIVGAPFRLLTMLIAMPFRPLSGYFVGQSATPGFTIFASLWSLRKELSVRAQPYWTREVIRRFSWLFTGVMLYQMSSMLLGLVQQTVLRQRLPEVDSAAYYLISRFADVANFLSAALYVTLFPYTAELAEKGRSTRPLVLKSSVAMLAFSSVLALLFGVFGRQLLSWLPNGSLYVDFAWTIPWLTVIMALYSIPNFHANTEVSAGRFGFLRWWVPYHLISVAALLFVTGYGYFADGLPGSVFDFLREHNVRSLEAMLWWLTADAVLKTVLSLIELRRQNFDIIHRQKEG